MDGLATCRRNGVSPSVGLRSHDTTIFYTKDTDSSQLQNKL